MGAGKPPGHKPPITGRPTQPPQQAPVTLTPMPYTIEELSDEEDANYVLTTPEQEAWIPFDFAVLRTRSDSNPDLSLYRDEDNIWDVERANIDASDAAINAVIPDGTEKL